MLLEADVEIADDSVSPFPARKRVSRCYWGYDDLTERTVNALWPWSRHDYPGRQRGFLSSIGRPLTWGAVKHWRSGRNRLPAWAARAMAGQLEERARIASGLAAELQAHADRMDATPMFVHGRAYPRKKVVPDAD